LGLPAVDDLAQRAVEPGHDLRRRAGGRDVDADTARFLLMVFPELHNTIIAAAAVGMPLIIVLWRIDPFRIRCSIATMAGTACLAGIVALAGAVQERPWEPNTQNKPAGWALTSFRASS